MSSLALILRLTYLLIRNYKLFIDSNATTAFIENLKYKYIHKTKKINILKMKKIYII